MNDPATRLRQVVRGAEPVAPDTLESIERELTEYRHDQWRMTPLQLIAILVDRLNWQQTKEFMRGALGPDVTNEQIVTAADRLTEWAGKTAKNR